MPVSDSTRRDASWMRSTSSALMSSSGVNVLRACC